MLAALLAVPALYLAAALIGSLIPVNRGWTEPAQGTTIYLADNGIHGDIIMPVEAEGLDWHRWFPSAISPRPIPARDGSRSDPARSASISIRRRWRHQAANNLVGTGRRQARDARRICAEPLYAVREIRLRPEEYRRLWAAIRADFVLDANGRPQRIDHPGYGPADAFYRATGKASAIRTCNSWVADRLRLAGVKTSLWPPFVQGLVWRYRKIDQRT